MSGKMSRSLLSENSVALLNMFIPIASPLLATNLRSKLILISEISMKTRSEQKMFKNEIDYLELIYHYMNIHKMPYLLVNDMYLYVIFMSRAQLGLSV